MAKITIYSTPTCPYCEMTKEYFKKNNIQYEDYDVSANEEKAKEMIQKSHQMGVPVIDVNGEIIVGFDRPAIDKALKISQ
ncbi:thioredoxin family protein [Candidatus Wolfebacteria bacterium]|nr:thioredoxin family protein [Candidatus Wolfebacteria bacterium]